MKKILHSGNVIIAGFVCMILFMSYLVFRCTQNQSVMVSENYYEQEMNYQNTIDARNNTTNYNSQFAIQKQSNELQITVPADINNQLTSASVLLYNKADDKKDKNIELSKNATGIYSIATQHLSAGNYVIKMNMKGDKKSFYKEFEITI